MKFAAAFIICAIVLFSVYSVTGFRFGNHHLPEVASTNIRSYMNISSTSGGIVNISYISATTYFGLKGLPSNSMLSIGINGSISGYSNPPTVVLNIYINGTVNSTLHPQGVGLIFNDFGNNTNPVMGARIYGGSELNVSSTNVQKQAAETGFSGFGTFSLYGRLTNQSSRSSGTTSSFHFRLVAYIIVMESSAYSFPHIVLNGMADLTGFANPVTSEMTLNITSKA
ncbi:MAG: hypothetical protein KIS30_07935 [Thermoplasmata archaeon]|nr:hypothetical protein [Candidatus Sysuiplasma acidicola]MBX8646668.1 hypothetical protein [Candidatus Sysuiplasma acidicola]